MNLETEINITIKVKDVDLLLRALQGVLNITAPEQTVQALFLAKNIATAAQEQTQAKEQAKEVETISN